MPNILERYELDVYASKDHYKVIDEIDVLTGWTPSGAGVTATLDTVNFRSGGAGVKITVPTSIAGTISKATGGINLSGNGITDQIRFWLYVNTIANLSSASLQLIDSAGSPITATYVITGLVQGWNRISVPKSAFTNNGTVNWSTIATTLLAVTATGAGPVQVTIDMLRLMLGPAINYLNGIWNESNGVADIVDNKITFFDNGYWEYLDSRIKTTSFYRVGAGDDVTAIIGDGFVRISGNGKSLKSLEILMPQFEAISQLIKYQPYYYADSTIMKAIRSAQGRLLNQFISALVDMFQQSFFNQATYMLDEHEATSGVGVASSAGISLLQRRNRISTRYVFAWLKANIDNMEKLVERFGVDAVVTEQPATYAFTVNIVSPKGVPANIGEIQTAVERYKPAHLNYTIVSTFTTWNQMDAYNRTWNNAEVFKWDSFEIS